jgi:predicted TIM-barrel fold metal-dependent hydrolase
MIDIHTHAFNAGYLPLNGILRARNVPAVVAWPLARIFEAFIEYEDLVARSNFAPALRNRVRAAVGSGASWKSLLAEGADPITTFVTEAPPEFLESQAGDIDAALAALSGQPSLLAAPEKAALDSASARLSPRLLAMPAGDLREKLWRLIRKVADIIRGGIEVLQWIVLLLQKETDIVSMLFETYPHMKLYVHHMMDLGPHYKPKRCLYPYDHTQLTRVRALSERYKGKLLAFVAYSPFRRNDLELIKYWLAHGCAGVKFYAPSGYRPIGNTVEDLQNGNFDPAEVDANNMALFQYCVDNDVPIFAHCQPGEFERRKGSGCLSHPNGWERVLITPGLEKLRLCLAHAGGEGWTSAEGREDDGARDACGLTGFISGAVKLATTFPNVYLEFGCMDTILERDGVARANFSKRLRRYMDDHGDRLGHRIVYGSDWHMLAKHVGHADYEDEFQAVFKGDPVLAAYESRFFETNALEYLNLKGYLKRSAGSITKKEREYLEGLLVEG